MRCEQCKVWGREYSFVNVEEAEEHVLQVHPTRMLRAYRIAALDAASSGDGTFARRRTDDMMVAMIARTE